MSIRLVIFLSAMALVTVATPARAARGAHVSAAGGASHMRSRGSPRGAVSRTPRAAQHSRVRNSQGVWLGGAYIYGVPFDDEPFDDAPVPPTAMPDEKTILWGRTGNPCFGCHWGDDAPLAPPVEAPPHTPRMKIIDVQPEPAPHPSSAPAASPTPAPAPTSHHRAVPVPVPAPVTMTA